MKYCNTCDLSYEDETIRFCRVDGTALVATFDNPQSIAVLPFVNMSADPDNEIFCDGLSEEVTHALANVDEYRVAARTSAFAFKNRDRNVRDIGRELNVDTILEGSVRRTGDRLRITAQLIDAKNGYHVWSNRYDHELKDALDLQDQISLAIVGAITS